MKFGTFFLIALFLCLPAAATAQEIERKIVIQPSAPTARPYFYVPFDVPTGVRSLTVEYIYDRKNGANTLDLGLFDSDWNGSDDSLRGFRGWSGGRRSRIFIGENSATNGYNAGRLIPGTWRLILGLYRVAAEGVEVTIKVRFNAVDEDLRRERERESRTWYDPPRAEKLSPAPEFGGYRWYRGDLHMHTFHSDGYWNTEMILQWARAVGLDFVGLTEHNTNSHHGEIDRLAPRFPGLLVLKGEEVTTYGGHFNVWGLPAGRLIDFRVTPGDSLDLQRSLRQVRNLNLAASLNHPTALCGGCGWSYDAWDAMDAVEIWNGEWDTTDESALQKWDALLAGGRRIFVIGSSDTHRPPLPPSAGNPSLGEPTLHAGMKRLSTAELVSAVRNGRSWISATSGPFDIGFTAQTGRKKLVLGEMSDVIGNTVRLFITIRKLPLDSNIRLISDGRVIYQGELGTENFILERTVPVTGNTYFRVEVRDRENRMLALTNPIYFTKAK